MDQELANAAV